MYLPSDSTSSRPGRRWGSATGLLGAALIAVAVAGSAVFAVYRSGLVGQAIVALFGPPQVLASEAYDADPDGPSVDHSAFDILLRKHVNEQGKVRYDALAQDARELKAYTDSLAQAPFDKMGRNHRLALLLNAYNAFTLQLILEHYDDGKLRSIKDIPEDKRWDAKRWKLGGRLWSLSEIEHEEIRVNFREARTHWALVCAAQSCPPLRAEAYTADNLDAQLADQARRVHADESHVRFDPARRRLTLTSLYHWYGHDFEQAYGSVPAAVAEYHDRFAQEHSLGRQPFIRWTDYDWSLNAAPTPKPATSTQPATRRDLASLR